MSVRNIVLSLVTLWVATILLSAAPNNVAAQQPVLPEEFVRQIDISRLESVEMGRASTSLQLYRKSIQADTRHTLWWVINPDYYDRHQTALEETAKAVVMQTAGWTYGIIAYDNQRARLACGPVGGNEFITCLKAINSSSPQFNHGDLVKALLRVELAINELIAQTHEGSEVDVVTLFIQGEDDNKIVGRRSETECAQEPSYSGSAWCVSRRIRRDHHMVIGLICDKCSSNYFLLSSGRWYELWYKTATPGAEQAYAIVKFTKIPEAAELAIYAEEERGMIDHATVNGYGGSCKGIPDDPRDSPYTSCIFPMLHSFVGPKMSFDMNVRSCPGCVNPVPQIYWDVELLDKYDIVIATYPAGPSRIRIVGSAIGQVFLPMLNLHGCDDRPSNPCGIPGE